MADCLNLLHFHLGSQITNIRQIKGAVNEAVRVYVDLARAGAGLQYLDVGGGLGIDYDGSQTDFESSVNYTLQEYANDVIYHVQNVCDEVGRAASDDRHRERPRHRGVPQRAGLQRPRRLRNGRRRTCRPKPPPDAEQPLIDLAETYRGLTAKNLLESYHDTQQALDQALNLFSLGLPLARAALHRREPVLGHLAQDPDAWRASSITSPKSWKASTPCSRTRTSATSRCSRACPIAGPSSSSSRSCRSTGWKRSPTRHAVLGDITCDSDGKVDAFIDRRDVKRTLSLHPFERRRLLPRRVPARRLPGDPRRPAQSVRRHQRRPRAPRSRPAT